LSFSFFLSLRSFLLIDIIADGLEAVNPSKKFFCDFFGTGFALGDFPAFGTPFAY
jgi:hypothetical protein